MSPSTDPDVRSLICTLVSRDRTQARVSTHRAATVFLLEGR